MVGVQVERQVKRAEAHRATPDADELAEARSLLASWEVEQDACAGRGVAWSAYRNGGVAELRSIVAELAAEVDVAPRDR